MKSESWYSKGIAFACHGCGGCCSGEPGYVWINDEEIAAMCNALAMEREPFMQKYTRRAQGRVSLIEKPNYDCIFLNENGCTLYDARPIQCRTYPFWKSALSSRDDFNEATCNCPGVTKTTADTRLYSAADINEIATSSTL